ncbi:DUF1993 domain-containing protein [Sinorhizobium sp. BG8]|uniref:DUF1993 domain-containing protein n=1 Tax=Sinorhizobium sp. BG8 TaxID=2613773 RepID=UPI00193E2E6A|nr:DUF1993 domain-containing protein [Sinorhizobium sp. BG8]QRM56332.1 DUF1993 domain-containing protein [Sinorhizobium sp. BG8]
MPLTMYKLSVPVFLRGLTVLSTLVEKAETHAQARNIAPEVLINARLYPDMLPFSAQIQRVSDTSKNAIGRLTGTTPPSFPDEEKTFAELKERISNTISYLQTVSEADLDGTDTRQLTLNVGKLKVDFTGEDYLLKFALPNFFFHVATAHDILRHNGVEVGKRDYLGPYD